MKRQFLMWMTMICILFVGISVTRMTRDFVASQSMHMKSDRALASEPVTTESIVTEGVREEYVPEMAMNLDQADPVPETEIVNGEEARSETAADETMAAPVMNAALGAAPASPKSPLSVEAENDTAVKSPLDPVIYESVNAEGNEAVLYDSEAFFERFSQTEERVIQIWQSIPAESETAYAAAAEQERVLWDVELNLVYNTVSERLSQEQAEELKILEREWIKERDLYAEKKAAKSGTKNAYNQSSEYIKALAEQTKERCYWLVSEYEDVLNGEETIE